VHLSLYRTGHESAGNTPAACASVIPSLTAREWGVQVAGIMAGDAELTGRALDSDCLVEPVRGPLIPGFSAVKQAAKAAGTAWTADAVQNFRTAAWVVFAIVRVHARRRIRLHHQRGRAHMRGRHR
jgi:hypothetical protein